MLYEFLPLFTGVKVIYDLSRPVGSRVVDAQVRCSQCLVPVYEPLQQNALYNVLTNSFILDGGDGYHMFKDSLVRYNYRK